MFDISIHSRDIRDQSRKLTEIAPNFGRFFALPNFRERAFQSYTHFITPASQHIAWKKFCEDTPTSPGVIRAHTLNFRPNFKFSGLKFLRGPPSQLWCAPVAYTYKGSRVCTHPLSGKYVFFVYLIAELSTSVRKTCSCSIVRRTNRLLGQ